ncbi:phosphatase PAP2 family protein [Sulfurovum sp. zt1-1]|uniref:Phosphatase PAP2 family protein n=1 Tax=Sulfurovum zhangzhouensis TaxID=3019067 RepID=A0ABT7QZ70_9BACT|nr:phosphatase PAP2 family protein [Sulfurovum zhangzhouensis]MDM5272134.1 phosphatase PAP2 family protein [Sulfurovum zhangzhouensis]
MLKVKHLYILAMVASITVLFYLYADREVAKYFYEMDEHNPIKFFFRTITQAGQSEWFLIPSLILYLWFIQRKVFLNAKKALYIFMTNVVAGIGVWLFKIPFGRMRPKLYLEDNLYGFQWFEISSKYVSFPSGHTITAISSAVALSLLFPKWKYPILIAGALVAFSRVVITAHYLSDVFFASFLGTMVAYLLYQYYFSEGKDI